MSAEPAPVTVYTLFGCIHCDQARALLRRREIVFTEIPGNRSPAFRRMLLRLTARASVPQIMIDGAPVGSASDLARLDRRGVLMALVQREPVPRAVVICRLNPVGLLTTPFGGTCGLWRHRVDILERDGRAIERVPARSAEHAVEIAASFNENEEAA